MTKLNLGKKIINILLLTKPSMIACGNYGQVLGGILILISSFLFTKKLMKTQAPCALQARSNILHTGSDGCFS